MKQTTKRNLSNNAKEIRKTGGGSALLAETDDFGYSPQQIVGLDNVFDSDSRFQPNSQEEKTSEISEETEHSTNDEIPDEEVTLIASTVGSLKSPYKSKKKSLRTAKDNLIELKETGMILDNEIKELQKEKLKIEIERMKNYESEKELEDLKKQKLKLEIEELKMKVLMGQSVLVVDP